MDWKMSDWYGLYRERWGDDIVPDAYAHPAKYARALIRRIYRRRLYESKYPENSIDWEDVIIMRKRSVTYGRTEL